MPRFIFTMHLCLSEFKTPTGVFKMLRFYFRCKEAKGYFMKLSELYIF